MEGGGDQWRPPWGMCHSSQGLSSQTPNLRKPQGTALTHLGPLPHKGPFLIHDPTPNPGEMSAACPISFLFPAGGMGTWGQSRHTQCHLMNAAGLAATSVSKT